MSDEGSPGRLERFLSAILGAPSIQQVEETVAAELDARSCRLLVVDYSSRELRPLVERPDTSGAVRIDGTMAGRCFSTGVSVSLEESATTWLPLQNGIERIGVAELHFDHPRAAFADAPALLDLLVLTIESRHRFTDVIHRARRSEPLSEAAEAQWSLLPPLAHAVGEAAIAGALEPAYEIAGDSFDYAFNPEGLDFAMLDAAGHGLDAVLMASAAIHCLRNARRSRRSLADAYAQIDRRIRTQFGESNFVTGQLCSLDLTDGTLSWINAGHVLPLHVRNNTFIGELECRPSLPMGLHGVVAEVASVQLQPGDRILFYTDGVTESRSADGLPFGAERLADFLVRATIDSVPPTETVRRLVTKIFEYVGGDLRDDATVLLVDYTG